MESLIRNLLLVFGLLYIIDFITEYPKTFDKVDSAMDIVKDSIGEK